MSVMPSLTGARRTIRWIVRVAPFSEWPRQLAEEMVSWSGPFVARTLAAEILRHVQDRAAEAEGGRADGPGSGIT